MEPVCLRLGTLKTTGGTPFGFGLIKYPAMAKRPPISPQAHVPGTGHVLNKLRACGLQEAFSDTRDN